MESIFVGIPTYDEWVHKGCMMGVLHASRTRNLRIMVMGSSATPFAFNQLWAAAAMSDCTYWAMCHADVGPDANWADTLIDLMEEHDADIMSATIPIKDSNNVYSTALAHMGRPVHYRLTPEHAAQLPKCFDSADICRVTGKTGHLCVNTGCWVCRLDRPWIRKVDFQFITSIDWSGDKPRCHFIPEDWLLSQRVTEMGGKVMGTLAVRCTHNGIHNWVSQPYEECDATICQEMAQAVQCE